MTPDQVRVQYDLESSAGSMQFKVLARNSPQEVVANSFADFCHFRDIGVSQNLIGRTFSYQIYAPPWRMFPVQDIHTTSRLSAFFGKEFEVLDRTPDSVLFFEGSDVALSGTHYPEVTEEMLTMPPPSLTTSY